MVTPTDTKVIDPEFAVYGPIGFDPGAFMANLLLAYLAQDGHAAHAGDRDALCRLDPRHARGVLDGFSATFLACWRGQAMGDALGPALFADAGGRPALDAFRHES